MEVFRAAHEGRAAELVSPPAAVPPNADGSINRKAVLEQLFASVDEGGDGHVTLTEFLAMFDDVDLDGDLDILVVTAELWEQEGQNIWNGEVHYFERLPSGWSKSIARIELVVSRPAFARRTCEHIVTWEVWFP